MTTKDRATGLPLLGDGSKSVPIDPKLLPELRELEEKRNKSRADSHTVGYQLVLMIGTAAAVGTNAIADEREWQQFVVKLAALHGIEPQNILGTDLDKGVILLK